MHELITDVFFIAAVVLGFLAFVRTLDLIIKRFEAVRERGLRVGPSARAPHANTGRR